MRTKITTVVLALLCVGLSGLWAQTVPVTNNLKAHFKADGLTPGALATWSDASGSANHLTQSTVANQPTVVANVLNGMPVVRFDGTNDNMKKSAFTTALSQPNTTFIVWKTATSVRQFAIGGGTSGPNSNNVFQGTADNQNRIAIFGGTRVEYIRTDTFQKSARILSPRLPTAQSTFFPVANLLLTILCSNPGHSV